MVVGCVFTVAVAAFWLLVRSFVVNLGCMVVAAFHAFWLVLAVG